MRHYIKSIVQRVPAAARLVSAVRGQQQQRAAAVARQVFEGMAAARGITALDEAATVAAVRARLSSRALQNGWPKQKGALHLFVAFAISDWERVLLRAFDPFGEVTIFEFGAAGFDQQSPDWADQRTPMNVAMRHAFDEAHARRPVDVVVGYLSGANTQPETLAHMAAQGAAIFNFSYDDKLDASTMPDGTPRGPAALAAVTDLNLSSDPHAGLKYALHGGLVRFHPESADPATHRPYDVPFSRDVSFVGAHYGFRPFFIEKLRRLGVAIDAFGRGWPGGALDDDDMVALYSHSRINLGFGGIGHSRTLMCLKGRDFEVPLSGGLYLTQHNPELALVFDIGREIVTYADEADCASKIRALLADPERAAAIRAAGRDRCLRDHTYEARWTQVFVAAGLI